MHCMHDHAQERKMYRGLGKFLLRGEYFGWVERWNDGGEERRKYGIMEAVKGSEQTVAVAHNCR